MRLKMENNKQDGKKNNDKQNKILWGILIAVLIFGDFLLFWLCKYIGMPIDLFWGLIF